MIVYSIWHPKRTDHKSLLGIFSPTTLHTRSISQPKTVINTTFGMPIFYGKYSLQYLEFVQSTIGALYSQESPVPFVLIFEALIVRLPLLNCSRLPNRSAPNARM
jgi:hypothetical protein